MNASDQPVTQATANVGTRVLGGLDKKWKGPAVLRRIRAAVERLLPAGVQKKREASALERTQLEEQRQEIVVFCRELAARREAITGLSEGALEQLLQMEGDVLGLVGEQGTKARPAEMRMRLQAVKQPVLRLQAAVERLEMVQGQRGAIAFALENEAVSSAAKNALIGLMQEAEALEASAIDLSTPREELQEAAESLAQRRAEIMGADGKNFGMVQTVVTT